MRNKILITLAVLIGLAIIVWWYFGFSLGFMKFFAAEQVEIPVTESPGGMTLRDRVICMASATVKVGQVATLRAQGGEQQYEWFAPGGTPDHSMPAEGEETFSVSYRTPGTKIVTVQAKSYFGDFIDSVPCTVTVIAR